LKAYEGIFILDPNLQKDDIEALIKEIQTDITNNKGSVEETLHLGKRRLTHKIKKCIDGYYVLINFFLDSTAVIKLHPKLKLNDSVFRYMFVDRDKKGFSPIKTFVEEPAERSYGERSYGERSYGERSYGAPSRPVAQAPETPKEEAPKEEVLKEDAPKEEVVKEAVSKEEVVKEEAPKEEAAAKEEAPKEEVPKEDAPKEEVAKEDQSTNTAT